MKYYISLELSDLPSEIKGILKKVRGAYKSGYRDPLSYHVTLVGYSAGKNIPKREFIQAVENLNPIEIRSTKIKRQKIRKSTNTYIIYCNVLSTKPLKRANTIFYKVVKRHKTNIDKRWEPENFKPHLTLIFSLVDKTGSAWEMLRDVNVHFSIKTNFIRVYKIYANKSKPIKVAYSAHIDT